MEVTIWSKLTIIPATNPIASKGRLNQKVIHRACWNISTATLVFMRLLFSSLVEALHQRAHHEIPAVHQNEKQDLERRRQHDGRKLDHADGQRYRGDHQIDDQEGEKQDRADLEAGFQLG